jgi:hypothetical protein
MPLSRIGSAILSVFNMWSAKEDALAAVAQVPPDGAVQVIDSPETAAEQDRLHSFINDFLTPIAADGKLDWKCEDTPLLAAFYAYGIDELLARGKDEVETAFRNAIRSAADRGDSPRLAADLVPAWNRISQSERTSRISKAEYEKIRTWFRQQASKPRVEYEFDDQLADTVFGKDSIDPSAIKVFYRLFRDIRPTDNEQDGALLDVGQVTSKATSERVTSVEFDKSFLDELVHRIKTATFHLREDEIVRSIEPLFTGDKLPGMAFDECRTNRLDQAVVVPDAKLADNTNLWFLGDIHGDLLALECALSYIQGFAPDRPYTLVLLGDLFDDGGYAYEVLLRVFDLIAKEPGRIALLTGNHDESLGRRDRIFTSSVSPSDFTDWLNQYPNDSLKRRAGELAIEYFKTAPRALFLPDGLLVAHGGVPHSGRWGAIQRREDFNSKDCLQDFVWNRAHERARTRIPSDASRGCEFGYEDFTNFCKLASKVLGQPVERMVRGHDHVEDRYLYYTKYVSNPILTINAMSRRLPREVFGPYERVPCVARWVKGQLPEVHQLMIPPEVVREVYPEPKSA